MLFLNLSFATVSFPLFFVFGATFLHTGVIFATKFLTKTKTTDVNWFCHKNKWISIQNAAPGLLLDRSWASPRPRWASFCQTLAVTSALSRRPSVLEGLPGFKNYFFEDSTGQQKSKMRINLNFVCNRFVFLGFVSPKVLTFTFLLHFATTTYEKSKHLNETSCSTPSILPRRLGEASYNYHARGGIVQ